MLWKLIKQTICEVNHDRLLNQWQSDVLEGLVGWTFVDVVVPVSQVVEFDDEGVLDPFWRNRSVSGSLNRAEKISPAVPRADCLCPQRRT